MLPRNKHKWFDFLSEVIQKKRTCEEDGRPSTSIGIFEGIDSQWECLYTSSTTSISNWMYLAEQVLIGISHKY